MSASFKGADRFSPISYKEEWGVTVISLMRQAPLPPKQVWKLAEKDAAKRAKKKPLS